MGRREGEEQRGRETLIGSSGQALAGQYKKRQEETHNLLCEPLGCCHLEMKDTVKQERDMASKFPNSQPACLSEDR